MDEPEWQRWEIFYGLHPFDDFHRFQRPSVMVASSYSGAAPDDLVAWLERRPPPPPEAQTAGWSVAEINTFKAFGMKPPRRQ